jgi:UDP-GlcNAc:undecaprenyl-phosphate/decaprenyl-phosphate GlcNAc-1-phosphate transferase
VVDHALILGFWGGLLSILCLVGFLNALNMMDGKNGLVIGMSLFWCVALLNTAPTQMSPMLVCLTVALLVTLGFNLAGRLFLGDSGSYALSGLIGIIAIYTFSRRPGSVMAEQVLLWLSLPVMDCLRVMAARLGRGQSMFHPGRDHFHHYLSMHLGWERGKYVCWALVWVPGIASLVWPAASLPLLALTIASYVVLVRYMVSPRRPAPDYSRS